MREGRVRFYAHTDPADAGNASKWEPLFSPDCQALFGGHCEACARLDRYHGHLNKVAWWTAKFAAEMFPESQPEACDAARRWGWLAGLWHDLGKFSPRFQRKLNGERIQIEHAGAGAALAKKLAINGWHLLAFIIAGHHSGLPNALIRESTMDVLSPLEERLERAAAALDECRAAVERSGDPALCLFQSLPDTATNPSRVDGGSNQPYHYGSLVRMLFSALVDADSIATERFCSAKEKTALLRQNQIYDAYEVLRQRLDLALDAIAASAHATDVNALRAKILQWCRDAATRSPGFFTLNVPTGGGKTLASMSFALRHIVANQARGMRRIIVVVPYTSIIEQNAAVYRDALGAHNVIEHHSNLDDFEEQDESDETSMRRRLACENWDAPVIVTTNVQFFESLFANKRRRLRKLHNIAGSVIILDEAQSVPADFIQLILTELRILVETYGCTAIVSTATQPAWKQRTRLECGIPAQEIHPIIPPDAYLSQASAFDRVDVEWPSLDASLRYEDLAARLAAEPCVMAIVHRKRDAQWLARRLAELQSNDPLFHLSTNMCPAHRRKALERIRKALNDYRQVGTPCRIVSTQLIEAGVDLDVPVVYRALAGLDSLAQAAGRCNREGRIAGKKGRVVVFIAETEPPDGHLKRCAEVTRQMLCEHGGTLDLRDSATFEQFFVMLYRGSHLDAKNLARHVRDGNFETVGREFRLIEDRNQVPVIIPYDEHARWRLDVASRLVSYAGEDAALRYVLRALQAYVVDVWPKGITMLGDSVQPLFPDGSARVLNRDLFPTTYQERFGLVIDDEPPTPHVGTLIV